MWLMDTMSYELHSLTSALVVFLFLRFHYYNFTSDDMICTVFSSGVGLNMKFYVPII